ncbi:ATP-NAD kinase family protein [Glaciecola petra]|uniref:ATP-NAD kinase family protein n=1 Tax=Glaciecola petra TaxID=3075602 RepID=A0ABU2ZMV2_9ALTE|nr:ATP-NAD kinase family protein [Aestuariibacter sp. P117]MDT0593952.1 ATP-NAD kinase family protein [Aestuariibacter sp. P117]
MNIPFGRKFKLGLVINPFAGIGGSVALKGSDGREIREKALAAGAPQLAMQKAQTALNECSDISDYYEVYTGAGAMGEDTAVLLGLTAHIVSNSMPLQTEAEHTCQLVKALENEGVDLILFAGGDGTAINVCESLTKKIPVLGVPAGCKIHSGVYAITPRAAGSVLAQVIKGNLVSLVQAEVRDIDEEQFRKGKVIAKHFGELWVPESLQYIQAVKMGGKESDELLLDDIAEYLTEIMQDNEDYYFVMGSGSTVDAIMQHCNLPNTLLGVDLIYQNKIVKNDVNAQELIELTAGKPTKLIITLIGGQGHILGRGNQQLSPAFIQQIGKANIVLVATKTKIQGLAGKGLISDSGDHDVDHSMLGPISIITGYRDQVLYYVGV